MILHGWLHLQTVRDYEQLFHHTHLRHLIPEDFMWIENNKWVLILLPELKYGETNPFGDFYAATALQSNYATTTITARVYYKLNCFIKSNPDYTTIKCGLNTVSNISHKFGSNGTGITIRFLDHPSKLLVKWSYLLHDNYSAPLQLWCSTMEYNINFFAILKLKGNGPSIHNLFQKLLLEVEGDPFQMSSLCHAYTWCNECNVSYQQNTLVNKLETRMLHWRVQILAWFCCELTPHLPQLLLHAMKDGVAFTLPSWQGHK